MYAPAKKELARLAVKSIIQEIFEEQNIEILENEIIPDTLERMQVYLNKSKTQEIQIADVILFSKYILMLLVKVIYLDKPIEQYALFLGITGKLSYQIKDAAP